MAGVPPAGPRQPVLLPIVCLGFLAYSYYGGLLPQSWPIAHAGLDFSQIVDALYNSGSGIYGTPLDVAATYIVLFTIYGAVLDLSGASRFFVDLPVAAFRKIPQRRRPDRGPRSPRRRPWPRSARARSPAAARSRRCGRR